MSYSISDNFFPSSNDIYRIHYTVYTPSCPARAILQICHGMNEFIGRYHDFAAFLAENGIVACGCDHAGHGLSVNSPEDFGYFGEGDGSEHLVNDAHTLHEIMRKKYRRIPYFIMGHSMGSFVVRKYLTAYGDGVDGAIICGTAGSNPALGMGIALSRMLMAVKGKQHRSKTLKNIAFSGYNKKFEKGSPNVWLTRDKDIVAKYDADEKCNFVFTVKAYNDMFKMLKEINSPEWAQGVPRDISIFVIAGGDDPVGNYGAGPREVYDKLRDADLCDVQLKLYKNDRHEILNELDKDVVCGDILNWINEKIEGITLCRTMQ